MTAATVIAALCLPADARVEQRVPKKLLVENGAPTAADKRQINEGIEELHWIAALKPATIGVPVFRDDTREYLEIAVLSVMLRAGAKAPRLAELIHRAIPYPLLLILSEPLGISLSLCHLRWSQGHAGQMVLDGSPSRALLESTHPSCAPFLSALDVTSQPRGDLHAFYDGWLRCFDAYAAAQVTSTFTLCETSIAGDARRSALADHDRLTREIAALRAQAGRETQLNRRVELNLQLHRLEASRAAADRLL
ncbi:MAG: DUF4391 domain-containing protein [Verrucomicrobiales bacterium]|nr:DUF4391 domain-containing protein [Verrucomicrobiales bacterium]